MRDLVGQLKHLERHCGDEGSWRREAGAEGRKEEEDGRKEGRGMREQDTGGRREAGPGPSDMFESAALIELC